MKVTNGEGIARPFEWIFNLRRTLQVKQLATNVCGVTLQNNERLRRTTSTNFISELNLHFCPGFKSPFLIFYKSYIRGKAHS